jgi:hypothetical protein
MPGHAPLLQGDPGYTPGWNGLSDHSNRNPPVSEREEEEAMNDHNEDIKGSDGGDSLEGTDSNGSQDSYEVDDVVEDVKFPLARSDDEDSESKTGGNDKVDPDGK